MMVKTIAVFFIFFIAANLNAQPDDKFPPMKRIEELERIKLIDVLDMDEQTTLRFFARRSEHQKKIHELKNQRDEMIENLSEKIESNNEAEMKKILGEFIQIEKKIDAEKLSFFTSVSGILTIAQRARLVVFEREFREEIKGILMRDRKHNRR